MDMTPEVKYERIGRFIYGAVKYGGDTADMYNWMAGELGNVSPGESDDAAQASLQAAYFAKYVSDEQFQESHQRFMEMMKLRAV
jgi:hypothetical protein